MIQFYIAGPYTASTTPGVFAHVVRALRAAQDVAIFRGWLPIVPHVSGIHAIGTTSDKSWSDAMDKCMATISLLQPGRDRIVLLPGWEASKGTCLEVKVARTLNIDIWTLAQALDPSIIDADSFEPEETAEPRIVAAIRSTLGIAQ